VGNGGANQILQGGCTNLVACAEIDGAGRLRIQPGVEESLRIFQGSTFEIIELYMILLERFIHPASCMGVSRNGVTRAASTGKERML
jgi:hypothetical protein